MIIEHVALWVQDLERSKTFYTTYFGAKAGVLYHNPQKSFSSYFLTFDDGARLELMHRPDIQSTRAESGESMGWAHIALSVGNTPSHVDELTNRMRKNGCIVVGEPRRTGDGYYESVVLDPDGNRIELTLNPAS
ncbi:MAG: VOC family protein [Bacteroidota bacterium]